MGTFLGHIVPGLALSLLGLWHAINTIRAFCLKGSSFCVKLWYPLYGSDSKYKHLEIILILLFSIFSIILQVFDFPVLRFGFKLDNFEHATMFLHLAIFAMFSLSAEITRSSSVLSGVTGILAASVFSQELFLLHFHSTDHVGIEGHYHWLLQLIVFVSIVAALGATFLPNSFPAALILSISVVFQGCWFINMGFMLWIPEFVPKGCVARLVEASTNDMQGAVTCGSIDADTRARALANLQFSWILSGIMLCMGSICLKLVGKCVPGVQSTEYEQLHSRGTDVTIAIDGFK
uniref:Transmembrane protein 45B n=1 Tax=Rhizophora mucronata TaxID=61149 RepID=A0A2P2QR79_RHIMU